MCLGSYVFMDSFYYERFGLVDPSCVSNVAFHILLKAFMTREVRAIGLRSFRTLGGDDCRVFPYVWDCASS